MSTWPRFYAVVQSIPRGRVTSYGAVARGAGLPGYARQVGYALAVLPDDSSVPWHRVVNVRGEVSARRGDPSCEAIQRAILNSEKVGFNSTGRIDMERFGWEPPRPRSAEGQRTASPDKKASKTAKK